MRPENPYLFTVALIVLVLAVTRATRLIVDDTYPPVERFRQWFVGKVPDEWGKLVECPWCCSPYLALGAVGWFTLLVAFPSWTWLVYVWWIVNGTGALSWMAAFLTLRDEPAE